MQPYKISAAITVANDNINLRGAGIGATQIVPITAGQNAFVFEKAASGILSHCGISDMGFAPSAAITDVIRVVNHYWFTAERLRIASTFTTGINLYNASTSYIAVLRDIFTNGGQVGVRVGEDGTGDIQGVFLYNCHLDTATTAGLRVLNVGGLVWVGGEALYCQRGMVLEPPAGKRIKAVFVQGVFLDASVDECFRAVVGSATARISGVSFSSCSLNFASAGNGAIIAGFAADPGQLERVRFDGCDFLINALQGAYLTNCHDIDFLGCNIVGNGQQTNNAHSGIFADVGVSGLKFIGGTNGSGDEIAARQQYGIHLASGVNGVRIRDVDLTGNVTGPINDAGATDVEVTGCAGVSSTRSITATATAKGSDRVILANATGGAITVNLPAAASNPRMQITIKKTDASANAVTIDGNASETIDGAATLAISTQYQAKTLLSDGANWQVLS